MLKLAIGAACLCLAGPAFSQNINTAGNYNGDIGYFGHLNDEVGSTYGQTFTTTTDPTLESFSLYLVGPVVNEFENPTSGFQFKGYLYKWDGEKATGPALFASDILEYDGSPAGQPQEFRFDTAGVTLELGQQYVAFLSVAGISGGPGFNQAKMPWSQYGAYDQYTGGSFVYSYPRPYTDFNELTSEPWLSHEQDQGDVWFRAVFDSTSPVPEPAAWGMMIGGFGMAGAALRRRSRRIGYAA